MPSCLENLQNLHKSIQKFEYFYHIGIVLYKNMEVEIPPKNNMCKNSNIYNPVKTKPHDRFTQKNNNSSFSNSKYLAFQST